MRRLIFAVLVVSALIPTSHAQVALGAYPLGAFDTKVPDTINIGNLNALITVPVLSKPGRGLPLFYNLAYNSSVWTPATVSGSTSWVPDFNWGWTAQTNVVTGNVSASSGSGSCTDHLTGAHHIESDSYLYNFVYTDRLGVPHTFADADDFFIGGGAFGACITIVTGDPDQLPVTAGSAIATDGSGYTLTASYSGFGSTVTIESPSGSTFTAPLNVHVGSGAGSAVDPNGNTISVNSSGQFTDTTGNVVLTVAGTAPTSTTYTYTDTSGTSQAVTMAYSSYSVQTAFGCSGVSEYGPVSKYLVSSITYADGTSYNFTYEPTPGVSGKVTGRLASLTLPEGGAIDYAYSGGSQGIVCADGGTATLTRSMPNDPLTPSTVYTRTPGTNSTHTDVVDGLSNHAKYDFVNDPTDPYYTPYLINQKQYEGAAAGTPLVSNQSCLNGQTPDCTAQSLTLPITSVSTTSTLNGSAIKQSVQTYDPYYGLLADDKEYDYGSGSPGLELSETLIYYASLTNGIVNLPSSVVTFVPSGGSMVATSGVLYTYDGNSLTSTSGLPQHGSVSGSRGNLTSLQNLTGASTPSLITTAQYFYDDAGQLLTSEDAAPNSTTYSYDSGTDAFLTGVNYPTTGGVSHSTSATYDVVRGVKLTSVDLNGNTTTYTYDSMLRPYTTSTSGLGGWSQVFAYSLGPTSPYTSVSTLHATGGAYITATTYLDLYGRQKELDTTDTPSDDLVDYAYDADGNLDSVSNPYRSGGTVAYTTSAYDALARPTTVTDSDGSSQQQASYSGNSVTITDEAGNQRNIVSDGLGRTAKVLEPNSGGTLNLETDYLYVQNLTVGSGSTFTTFQSIVNQKGGSGSSTNWRTRTFTYDLLGRTLTATTPETGTTTYSYPNGTGSCAGIVTYACSRTDANSTSTTYSYDALNRPTGKTYGGSSIGTATASVAYYYDQTSYNGLTIANGNGLRTGMRDGSGNTAWNLDGMGRVAAVRKTLNSVTDQASYTYNADGTTNTLQDFGGTTFTYSYDVSGRPTSIVDGASNTYASSAVYNAAGQLTSLNHQLTSGGAAYVRSLSYNNRMQPYTISATVGGSPIQSLTYGYGTGGTNNGNILSITNGMDSSRSQTYTYDNLNRLASGRDATHWGETYTYDPWGNLYQTTQMTGLLGNNWSVTVNGSNQLSTLYYDYAGQVTEDQFTNMYGYDAEGRLITAGSGAYVYDGDGNRVEKTASSTTTLYWPGAGSLLDESNSTGSTMGKQVQFAGLLVWHEDTSGTGNFLFHDHLGSVRVTGNSSGTLADDNDYWSYGTQVNYGTSSDNHYLFTSYESDASESSTDYATFRNLSMSMGRFNRPDPYNGSYDLSNPQSLNRYSYVANNPIGWIDPLGLQVQIGNCVYDVNFSSSTVYDLSGNPIPDSTGDSGSGSLDLVGCYSNGSSSGDTAGTARGASGGGSGSAPGNGPRKGLFTCASEAGAQVSLANPLHKIPGLKGGVGGFVVDAVGGNAFSGLTDLIQSFGSGEGGGHSVLYNMGQAEVAGPTQGFGAVLGKAIEDTPWASGPMDVAMAATFGEYASGVGELKLAYDAGSYSMGLFQCAVGIIH